MNQKIIKMLDKYHKILIHDKYSTGFVQEQSVYKYGVIQMRKIWITEGLRFSPTCKGASTWLKNV